jgi:excisionase family DNA binding protein
MSDDKPVARQTLTLLTLRQAATRLQVHPDTLRAQIHRGRLTGIKLGRDWLVDEAEVERYRSISSRRVRGDVQGEIGPS